MSDRPGDLPGTEFGSKEDVLPLVWVALEPLANDDFAVAIDIGFAWVWLANSIERGACLR